MSNLDVLQRLVGKQVTAMTEVRVPGDWRMVLAVNGVLSPPYGTDPGGTWNVGDRAVLVLYDDAKVEVTDAFVTATFGQCRVRIAADPPPAGQ